MAQDLLTFHHGKIYISLFNMLFTVLLVLGICSYADACSRVTYNAGNDRITIGRSVDFVADTNTTIFAFPAGLARSGGVGDRPFNWTSKYGSITTLMYDKAYTEGVNSEGLTGSTLYLGDSEFEKRDPDRPGMFVGLWMQYFLDMYATVSEAARDICPGSGHEPFQVVVKSVVPGVKTNLHLSFTDPSGDNLIMEYVKGKLTCWQSENYTVMTNEPTFDQQLAIDAYWGPIANSSLPGTARPAGVSWIKRH
jgi:choloylglycine hydrolase